MTRTRTCRRHGAWMKVVLIALLCPLIHAGDGRDLSFYGQTPKMPLGARVFRELAASLDADSSVESSSSEGSVTPVEKQQSSSDATIQPETTENSDAGSSSISVVVIAVGFVVLTGLVFFLATMGRKKSDHERPDSDDPPAPPSEHPRLCTKRKTFAVPDLNCTRVDIDDSAHSHVPVLGDDVGHRKVREASQLESNSCSSWANASATTSSYSIAPLSSRHRIPAMPTCIYTAAQGYAPDNSQTASEHSSHTDDYSIGMLESPVSTEYSFGSEEDDIFPLTPWDDFDSYRSMDYTFLSTTSSDVFDSNRGRSGSAWKQVNRPTRLPSIGSSMQPVSPGVLFVRQIDSRNMGHMRLDPRGRGARASSRMRFDVEV